MYLEAIGDDEDYELDQDVVEHHFTALVALPNNDLTNLVELDSERRGPYIRGVSRGNSLLDQNLIRKTLESGVLGDISNMAIFKLVRAYS